MREKTCGDCIHADICEHIHGLVLFHRKNIAYCTAFKDSAELVQVVRCKDCAHMKEQFRGARYCEVWTMFNGMGDDGFCNYGERKNDG